MSVIIVVSLSIEKLKGRKRTRSNAKWGILKYRKLLQDRDIVRDVKK